MKIFLILYLKNQINLKMSGIVTYIKVFLVSDQERKITDAAK